MIRTLTRQGNSLVFIVGRDLRELLEIDEKTPLRVTVEGRKLILEPMSAEERKQKFARTLETTNARFGKALRNLAK